MTSRKNPPQWAYKLVNCWLRKGIHDEVIGDLLEMYHLRYSKESAFKARILFIWEVLLSLKWSNSRFVNKKIFIYNGWSKLKSKEAYRFLKRNKYSSLSRALGFTAGISTCLLLLIFYLYEKSFDSFHADPKIIYRVLTEISPSEQLGLVPWPTGPYIMNDYPTIKATRVYHTFRKTPMVSSSDKSKSFYEDDLFFVDSTFFDVFSFRILHGDREKLLDNPQTIVLSESLARKFFGEQDPVGRELIFENGLSMEVTGIVEDAPANSHLVYRAFASLGNIEDIFQATGNTFSFDSWYWTAVNTYLKLPSHINPGDFEEQLKHFTQKHVPDEYRERRTFKLQPLQRIHLYSGHIEDIFIEKRSATEVNGALVLGVFILVIAMINYINLTTSNAIDRLKSITIHRLMGSSNYQIIYQLLAESILITTFSFLIAAIIAWLVIPNFNQLIGSRILFADYLTLKYGIVFLLSALILGMAVGLYPAVYTIRLVRKQNAFARLTNGLNERSLLRKALVTFQYFISIILIFGTLVIYLQFKFLNDKELGFEKENILMIPIKGTRANEQLPRFMDEINNSPYVLGVAVISDIMGRSAATVPFVIDHSEDMVNIPTLFTSFNFVDTYGLELIEGRDFNENIASDSSAFLANEAALKYFEENGWENTVIWDNKRIIGVLKNFHYSDLHYNIQPLMIGINDQWHNYLSVRVKPGNIKTIVTDLEKRWRTFEESRPFDPFFLVDHLQKLYERERHQTYIISIFSLLGIIIASMGVLGLINFTVRSKLKEIGIRKVLGASISQIYLLITKEFVILFLIAVMLAFPLSQYLMNLWLENYPLKVNIYWWHYLISAALVVFLTLITVSYRSIKAAMINPVEVIKDD